jgi:hypothetical protein
VDDADAEQSGRAAKQAQRFLARSLWPQFASPIR